ncbi:hypothetical protein AB0L13_39230, partial [Saccharopolyspora shandongensis]|uniref:hypothetical protein n=1 Tax=Saccharopolyspora shandongensis TaxID=418495 RepID=UPI0034473F7A
RCRSLCTRRATTQHIGIGIGAGEPRHGFVREGRRRTIFGAALCERPTVVVDFGRSVTTSGR